VTNARFVLLTLLGMTTPAPARAVQAGDSLPTGTTIRLVAPAVAPGTLTATVLALDHDTLLLKVPGEAAGLVIPLAGVERLEVYRGRTSGVAAMLGGGLAGLAVGGAAGWVLGPALCQAADDPDDPSCPGESVRTQRIVGAVVLGLLGSAYGVTVGARQRRERWQIVALERLRIGPSPGGGVALSLSLPF
jgi:hypothetical protein